MQLAAQEQKSISTGRARWSADTAMISAYIRRADSLQTLVDTDSLFVLYQEASKLSRQIGYDRATVYTLCKMGDIYFNHKKKFTQSKLTLYQALPSLPRLSFKDQQRFVPMTYNLLANALYMNGQNDSAIHYYSLALNAMKNMAVDNPKMLVEIYGNMGAVLSASRQYTKGIEYLKKALVSPGVDSSDLAKNYGNLGALYANFLNDMDSATYWWQHAITIYKARSAKKELQSIYANIGTGWVLPAHQDIDKAQRYFDSAIATDPTAINSNITLIQGLCGTNYYRGNYGEAIRYALQSLDIATVNGDREKEQYAYWALSYSYAHLGDTQKAHQYQRRLSFLEDSLHDEKIMKSISESESKYRLFEKNNELAENKARLYRQRLWLTASLGGGIILAGALLGIIFYARQRQRLQAGRLRNMEQQQQIDQLRVKMEAEENERARIARELHDGLGVLLSAAKINHHLLGKTASTDLSHNTAYRESGEIITQIYGELRSVTQNLIPDYIAHKSLEDALSVLIAKVDAPGFRVGLQAYGERREIHPEISFAIYRAIEEIVNNAIKHSGGTELMIQLLYHNDQLHITTEDDGKGFDAQKNYLGMGLNNITRRIEKTGGYITLSAMQGKGTMYSMEIPY
ncbi:tetratricopeptide repeat-containing sensor histidine kinase [Taibaiella chishuiensis]|uniref:Oxygen sensor histidine kinase NreB n=1 Tax=Taibaiella chishuiensis TaxID=1434707 RepID=A0A2P8D7K3_9BACT|nr:tetratricopeptide repeat-containing sensor histidine kinase [Taibaiella chishuiensis]PSK93169.1 histidine kinase/DNA gyrase B/HSP90-like ATPase [Taibaiella chishuiensis]